MPFLDQSLKSSSQIPQYDLFRIVLPRRNQGVTFFQTMKPRGDHERLMARKFQVDKLIKSADVIGGQLVLLHGSSSPKASAGEPRQELVGTPS